MSNIFMNLSKHNSTRLPAKVWATHTVDKGYLFMHGRHNL